MTAEKNRFDARMDFLEITPGVFQKIIEIEKYSTYWKTYKSLSPEYLGNLKKSVLVSSTGSSTRIEGSSLTDDQIEEMMLKFNMTKFSDRDQQEVAGYFEIIKHIFSAFDSISFSEGTILQFHEMSMKYSEKDKQHKGRYKHKPNKVVLVKDGKELGVIFNPTEPHLVQGEMIELLEWTKKAFENGRYNPLLVIGNFIFEYLSIHPFEDGNGRTSRLLTNLLLLKQGYEFVPYVSHEKIIEENKAEYYKSLRKSSQFWKTKEDENISHWILFFLKVVEMQGKRAEEITTKEDPEIFLSPDQTKVWRCFAKKEEWSRKELSEENNISPNSIDKIFQKLEKMKKIEKIGAGRATRWRKIK